MFLKIDDEIINLNQVIAISEVDSDFTDHTKFYLLEGHEVEFPRNFVATKALLEAKGLVFITVNDQEAIVKNKVLSLEKDDEENLSVYFQDGESQDFECSKSIAELVGEVDEFTLDEDEDDDLVELPDDTEEVEEEVCGCVDKERISDTQFKCENCGAIWATDEELSKESKLNSNSSPRNYSSLEVKRENNFLKLITTTAVITVIAVAIMYFLGIVK